jgi:hypothetical protein
MKTETEMQKELNEENLFEDVIDLN